LKPDEKKKTSQVSKGGKFRKLRICGKEKGDKELTCGSIINVWKLEHRVGAARA